MSVRSVLTPSAPTKTTLARMKDGKAVEFNSYPDIAGMMMQLGFMPEM